MLQHSVEEVILESGARGLLIHIPDASVMSYQLNFRAGDLYVADDKKWETAHIMEHLSLGANKKYPNARKYQAELEKNGAYSNASTAPNDMIYMAECADFEWDRVLEMLCDGVSQPLFLKPDFEAECGNVSEELMVRGNNHASTLASELAKRYGFRAKTFQDRADLMHNVTLEDIKQHYQATHFAANMRFIIAGNLEGRTAKVREILDSMPLPKGDGKERFVISREVPVAIKEPLFVANKTVPNAYFYIDTYTASELSTPEMHALGLLGTILVDTLYSRIQGAAREKGLIYYLSSNYYRTTGHSSWWFGSEVSERQLLPFLDIFVSEMKAVLAGSLDDDDIASAKMYQTGGHQMSAQTVHALTSGYGGLYYYSGEIDDYYTDFPKKIQKIQKAELLAVAHKMFAEKIWGLGFLGTISEATRTKAYEKLAELWV